MISARNLHKSYGALAILKGVSLEVSQGEIVSIVGASGAGKSTLLHLLGTLDKADSGTIQINSVQLGGLKSNELSRFRNQQIGFIFQFHHLLPEFTALENVCVPGFIAKQNKKQVETRAKALLERLGLSHRMDHKPNELSGGEQQRVAVARALFHNPVVIFADEPSGNLDSANAKALHDLFFELRKESNQTFVIVTHNEELAAMADRKLVMKDGLIVTSH